MPSSSSNSHGSLEKIFSSNASAASESKFSLELPLKSDDMSKVFLNKPMRRGKWTPEEERYALAIIDAFEAGILQGVDNGCTLRSCLSSRLHCAPMRVSKKFAGKSIGKQVFLSKMTDMYGIPPDPCVIQASKDRIRRLEQQFNISVLEEEGTISTQLDLMPSIPSTTTLSSNTYGVTSNDLSYINPLPAFLLQPQYRTPAKGAVFNTSKSSSVSSNDVIAPTKNSQTEASNNISNLFEAYQKAKLYHTATDFPRKSSNDESDEPERRPSINRILPTKKSTDVCLNNCTSSVEGSESTLKSSTNDLPLINGDSMEEFHGLVMDENIENLRLNQRPCDSFVGTSAMTGPAHLTQNSKSSVRHQSVISNVGTLRRNDEISEPVLISAADIYANHALQSILEVSKHSAYCKILEISTSSNTDTGYVRENGTMDTDDISTEISNNNSVNIALGLYADMMNNIQQTNIKRKSPDSDQGGPNEISGSDRSSDNCTNTNDGSWGDGSQNGVSTGSSDTDYSDTGSDEASIDKKKRKLNAAALMDNRLSLQKRMKN